MTHALEPPGAAAIVLDIEGTTTPVDFVYGVLFPFARAHASAYLTANRGSVAVRDALDELRREHDADRARGLDPPEWSAATTLIPAVVRYLHWSMDRDRKSTALKRLQGWIWEQGYAAGDLEGAVFADVRPALEGWNERGTSVAIFSSGSVLAQRLLFRHSASGDLSRYIGAYFDTTHGSKTDPASYRGIAVALARPPESVAFVSDVTVELDAARSAGLRTFLSLRPGNAPQPKAGTHARVERLTDVTL